jgi:altronate dehydratase
MTTAGRVHVVVNPRDNVTTILDASVGLERLQGGRAVAPGIPFGHKAALQAISRGEAVIKYGVTIGRATQDIAPGEHVHVHNCA